MYNNTQKCSRKVIALHDYKLYRKYCQIKWTKLFAIYKLNYNKKVWWHIEIHRNFTSLKKIALLPRLEFEEEFDSTIVLMLSFLSNQVMEFPSLFVMIRMLIKKTNWGVPFCVDSIGNLFVLNCYNDEFFSELEKLIH